MRTGLTPWTSHTVGEREDSLSRPHSRLAGHTKKIITVNTYHHTLTQPSATGYQRCRHASSRVASRVPQPQLNMGQSRLCGANAPFTSDTRVWNVEM